MYELKGADDLADLSRILKRVGAKDLEKELSKAIQRAMKPVREDIKASARAILPRRGGLNEVVAGSKTRIVRRNRGRAVGARLKVDNRDNINRIDRGTVRHPVWGNRQAWVNEPVAPGWFTKPTEAARPAVKAAIEDAMNEVARKIDKRG